MEAEHENQILKALIEQDMAGRTTKDDKHQLRNASEHLEEQTTGGVAMASVEQAQNSEQPIQGTTKHLQEQATGGEARKPEQQASEMMGCSPKDMLAEAQQEHEEQDTAGDEQQAVE